MTLPGGSDSEEPDEVARRLVGGMAVGFLDHVDAEFMDQTQALGETVTGFTRFLRDRGVPDMQIASTIAGAAAAGAWEALQ